MDKMNETRTERPTISQLVFDCVTKHAPISAKGIEQELKRMGIKPASVPALISSLRKQGKIEECGREQSARKDNVTRALYRVVQAPSKAEEKKESKPAEQRQAFLFYASFFDAINFFPLEQQARLYGAVVAYGLYHTAPEFTEKERMLQAVWATIKPQLDANWRRYENGIKGGAPAGNRNNIYGRKGKENTKNQPKINRELTENQPKEKEKEKEKVCVYTCAREAPHAHTDNPFVNFTEWIMTACPHVAALEEQMTEPQFTDYIEEFGREKLFQIVKEMENNISIGKNRSVYQTARNWTKRKK